ncbi:MAG: hypothetical protein ACRYG7_46180 [Janthinobacterium lividum]
MTPEDLIVKLLLGPAGYGIRYLVEKLKNAHPVKKLWNLKDPDNLITCVSASHEVDTGEHKKTTTGVGQVKAFGFVVESLSVAYNVKSQNVFMANEPIKNKLHNDLLLLGGSKHNAYTEDFIEKIQELNIVNHYKKVMVWKKTLDNKDRVYEGKEKLNEATQEMEVIKDYGLIIRMKNPYSYPNKERTICLFAGSHTYGTIAAAKFFTEEYVEENSFFKKKHENIFLLVECEVENKNPVNTRIIERYEF